MVKRSERRPAFTLVEMLISIVVMSLVGAVTLPITMSATDAFVESAKARRTAEDAAFALERMVRLLRDIPAGAVSGEVGIAAATTDSIRFSDGRGIELSGADLLERSADGTTALLCENVRGFAVTLRTEDGTTSAAAAPATAQRIELSLTVDAFKLNAVVLPRVKIIP